MKTDYIDLYLLHYPDPNIDITESMEAMERLLEKGLIRGTGVSRFSLDQLKAAARHVNISVAQYPLSMYDRQFGLQPGYNELHQTMPVLEYCKNAGIPVMAYGGLAKGLLTGKKVQFSKKDWRSKATRFQDDHYEKWLSVAEELEYIANRYGQLLSQFAISWTLSQPGVFSSVVGARTPEQIMQNSVASGSFIADEDLMEIERIMEKAGHCPDFYSE